MRPPSDSLSALLRRADPAAGASPTDPAAFVAAVHARIQSADTVSAWHGRPARGFASALARHLFPLAAALALLASLGAGSSIALARERSARTETYASAYARSIDPWLMHGPDATAVPGPDHEHAQP